MSRWLLRPGLLLLLLGDAVRAVDVDHNLGCLQNSFLVLVGPMGRLTEVAVAKLPGELSKAKTSNEADNAVRYTQSLRINVQLYG
jgi:hypothetical protein